MHRDTERQLASGLLYEASALDGSKKLLARTLLEACKWRISTKRATRSAVVKELFDRLARPCGMREITRVEAVIKTLPLDGA